MSNPIPTPATHSADGHASARPSRLWRFLRSVVVAVLVWCCFVALGAIMGGVLSCYTGKAEEISKWNGWSYFMFSVKEFSKFGAVLSFPFVMLAFAISWFTSGANKVI